MTKNNKLFRNNLIVATRKDILLFVISIWKLLRDVWPASSLILGAAEIGKSKHSLKDKKESRMFLISNNLLDYIVCLTLTFYKTFKLIIITLFEQMSHRSNTLISPMILHPNYLIIKIAINLNNTLWTLSIQIPTWKSK